MMTVVRMDEGGIQDVGKGCDEGNYEVSDEGGDEGSEGDDEGGDEVQVMIKLMIWEAVLGKIDCRITFPD